MRGHSPTRAEVLFQLCWSLFFECTLMGKKAKAVPSNGLLPSQKPVPVPEGAGRREGGGIPEAGATVSVPRGCGPVDKPRTPTHDPAVAAT